ncbi:receptor-like protein 56 [Malania oleifera]|uniref:receptor-like protein 56 n=1 Tax=Malania oleifera TaxID=397392 RepID=UPI0025ADC204|nr:receptor-like protein 56 [Malania oleifera]
MNASFHDRRQLKFTSHFKVAASFLTPLTKATAFQPLLLLLLPINHANDFPAMALERRNFVSTPAYPENRPVVCGGGAGQTRRLETGRLATTFSSRTLSETKGDDGNCAPVLRSWGCAGSQLLLWALWYGRFGYVAGVAVSGVEVAGDGEDVVDERSERRPRRQKRRLESGDWRGAARRCHGGRSSSSSSGRGCHAEERKALLRIKDFVKSNWLSSSSSSTTDIFPSWVAGAAESIDCCKWERVKCNSTTGRLMDLSLFNINNITYYERLECIRCEDRLLNASLFLPFQDLTTLNLSLNSISGFLPNQGFEKLTSLKKLEILDLGYNYFYKRNIFRSLGQLTSLKTLILGHNGLDGFFPIQELSSLKNLETLDLSHNHFLYSFSMQDSERLSQLSKLSYLDLSSNSFDQSVLKPLRVLQALRYLSLESNGISGQLSDLELDISDNNIEGTLPQCLNNLTNLRLLDLSKNQFTGKLSESLISSLTAMEYIDFSNNSFEGLFSFSSFANHSKLEVVQFLSFNDKFQVETDLSIEVPKFQLKVLMLSNCNLNRLSGGHIPKFVLFQYKLISIDLSHNNLTGHFPKFLLENNPGLDYLFLRNNSLVGQFRLPLTACFHIDVSDNKLVGEIQSNIGEMLPQTKRINISRNAFGGRVPSSISNISGIWQLDMSFNKFSGEVPKELLAACTQLEFLHLSHNRFHVLDISNNYLSGQIPHLMGNGFSLLVLNMQNNLFSGQFSCENIPYEYLDISYNDLSGTLPSCSMVQRLRYLHLEGNRFGGSIPEAFLNFSGISSLNIRYNSLFGKIPSVIGSLSRLKVLLLSGNHLSGLMPNELCQLSEISMMDLSNNSLSGSIPHCFSKITFGKFRGLQFSFSRNFEFMWDRSPYWELGGEIPYELGNLSWIHEMNLSHNRFAGPIPSSFSNLRHIESLDLSYNHLNGEIPSILVDLDFLAVFSVVHNNLSGRVPDKGHFLTFEASSFIGNPFLCGQILKKNCSPVVEPAPHSPEKSDGKWYKVEPVTFFASFAASYITFFLGVIVVLYVNPTWRRRLFYLAEKWFFSCYYFVYDAIRKFVAHMR